MTEKRDLIDTLIERTGVDPYKLKRLSTDELEQLLAAYKEGDETIDELLEALKPENYLSSREKANRDAVKNIWWVWDTIWRKITGQKEIPEKYELIFPLTITMIFMVLLIYFIFQIR